MRRRTQRGASAIEFAILLPILAILTTGAIDFGYYIQQYHLVVSAARDGAHRGSLTGRDWSPDPLQAAATTCVAVLGSGGLVGECTATWEGGPGNELIVVTADADFYALAGYLPTPPTLNWTVRMRMFDQPG